MSSFHSSYIEISRSALQANFDFLRGYMRQGVAISSVVKGNAYGHGIEAFVPLAQDCGQYHFSVFSADEALRVQKVGRPGTRILILGDIDPAQLEWAVEHDIECYVFDLQRLEQLAAAAQKMGKKARIHIDLETGMNRIGVSSKDLPKVAKVLQRHAGNLVFQGLCSHYAGAESMSNASRIHAQQLAYEEARIMFASEGLVPVQHHTACSAAALRYTATQMDMVRLGIVQYGFFPNHEMQVEYLTKNEGVAHPLHRLISWKTRVMDVKRVKAGEYIGYGTSFLSNTDMTVAVVPVGYSQGYSRILSNQGRMLVRGQRVSVVGTINMNMTTVDVTSVPGVQRGDEVVLIGRQGELEITVSSFSEITEQVNYELLTRLPHDIPRIVMED